MEKFEHVNDSKKEGSPFATGDIREVDYLNSI